MANNKVTEKQLAEAVKKVDNATAKVENAVNELTEVTNKLAGLSLHPICCGCNVRLDKRTGNPKTCSTCRGSRHVKCAKTPCTFGQGN